MPYHGSIQVQDQAGWTKTFLLEKALVMVGSGPVNDIVLPEEHGGGVSSVHLQLLHTRLESSHVRAVNLTGSPLPLLRGKPVRTAAISANAFQDLEDGDVLEVGEFKLVFSLQSCEGLTRSSRSEHLGLKLETAGLKLRAGEHLDGLLTVSNFGTQKRCQFGFNLEGLPADCYQIDPAPLLYPNGEEQLRIRIYHRGAHPTSGTCPVCLRMTAPGAYPLENVMLSFNLEVAPVYQVDVCVQEGKDAPAAWEDSPPTPDLQRTARVDPASGLLQKPMEAISAANLTSPMPEMEGNAPSTAAELPQNGQETQSSPIAPVLPAEHDQDWWSDTRTAQIAAQSADPYTRRSTGRKPRLTPDQKIQVLRTPEATGGSSPRLSVQQPEDSEQNG